MSFAQALLGRLTRAGIASAIQSQAETELGRPLNDAEVTLLFSRCTPVAVLEKIQKVNKIPSFNLIKNKFTHFSLDTAISSSSCF